MSRLHLVGGPLKVNDPEKEFAIADREQFYSRLTHPGDKPKFGHKNHQWACFSYNIMASRKQCPNNCAYCYMKPMNRRFRGEMDPIEDLFQSDPKKVRKGWRSVSPENAKLYMFPSSHDIFPESVNDYVMTALTILRSGHRILCVSKPRFLCIQHICAVLSAYKQSFSFRFTITTNDNSIIRRLEGNSPLYEERLESLKYASKAGFNTSVSMEPFISDPRPIIEACEPWASTIWLGTMSSMNELKSSLPDEFDRLTQLYQKEILLYLVSLYSTNPKIFWKESVMKICLS